MSGKSIIIKICTGRRKKKISFHFQQQVEKTVAMAHDDYVYEPIARMPITVHEVNAIIAKLNNGKAPGWANITTEHLKYSGPVYVNVL